MELIKKQQKGFVKKVVHPYQLDIKYIMCSCWEIRVSISMTVPVISFQIQIAEVYRFQLKPPLDEDEDPTHQCP